MSSGAQKSQPKKKSGRDTALPGPPPPRKLYPCPTCSVLGSVKPGHYCDPRARMQCREGWSWPNGITGRCRCNFKMAARSFLRAAALCRRNLAVSSTFTRNQSIFTKYRELPNGFLFNEKVTYLICCSPRTIYQSLTSL